MAQKTLVFAFGRFQPPTRGHAILFQTLLNIARKEHGDPMLFLSSKQDAKENPLSYEEKRDAIHRAMPEITFGPKDAKTPLLALDWAVTRGYTHFICYVGGAREADFQKLLRGWQNADPSRNQFTVEVRAIPRTGAMDPSKVSGTTARLYARQGNMEAFKSILLPGIPPSGAETLMTAIQDRLGPLSESAYLSFSAFIKPLMEAEDPDDQVLQQASQEAEEKDEAVPRPDEDAISADELPKKIAQQKGTIDAREAERVPSDNPTNQSKLVIHPDARLKKTMAANLQRWKEEHQEQEAIEESFTAEELIARC